MHEPAPGIVSNFLCNLSHFIPSTYHDIITIATSTLQGRKVMFRGVKSFAMQLERSFKYRSVCLSQKSCFLFSFFFSIKQISDSVSKRFGARCVLKFSQVQNGNMMHVLYIT